jgi:ATP phosphoribosyltransferase
LEIQFLQQKEAYRRRKKWKNQKYREGIHFIKLLIPKNNGLKKSAIAALKEIDSDVSKFELLEFRGEDIPFLTEQFLSNGENALGITGEDLFKEYCLENQTRLAVQKRFGWNDNSFLFGRPCLCLISPQKKEWKERNIVAINSKYARLSEDYLEKFRREGIQIETIQFNGNTELAVQKGLADKCVEIVCSGTTMKELGLSVEEKIFESDLVLLGKKQESKKFDLEALLGIVSERKKSNSSESYSKKLFEDSELLAKKINEECFELLAAFRDGKRSKIVWESCDLLYFLTVVLAKSNVTIEELWNELERRNNEKKEKSKN